jgi:prolyl 4-hydroxylase
VITPGSKPAWKAGDLNALFENIVDDANGSGEYLTYNPKAQSRPKIKADGSPSPPRTNTINTDDSPWLVSLENFLTDEEADYLIEVGKRQQYQLSEQRKDSLGTRTSYSAWCRRDCWKDDATVSSVVDRIAKVTKVETKQLSNLQLLRYEEGQKFKQHTDFAAILSRGRAQGQRLMTFLIYLSDVEEGGETSFPYSGVTIQPRKGHAVLWPNVMNDDPDAKEIRADHMSLPVLKGVKHAVSIYIHARDFEMAHENGCVAQGR